MRVICRRPVIRGKDLWAEVNLQANRLKKALVTSDNLKENASRVQDVTFSIPFLLSVSSYSLQKVVTLQLTRYCLGLG